MTDEELLADTNRLLRQFFDWDREQKAERERMEARWKADEERREAESKSFMADALKSKGVSLDGLDLTDENFEAKIKEIREKSQRNLEESKARELAFREDLLAELKIQTDLLNQIKEKLADG